jgi:hypothetical protein
MDQPKRDFRVTFPPVDFGETVPPVEMQEPPPRSGQKCANCNAFVRKIGPLGPETMCCAGPAMPFIMGIKQGKVVNPKTGQPDQFPWVVGFWPPTHEEEWCRAWEWAGPGNGK